METNVKMTRDEYLKFHKNMCDKARQLSEKKNADYAGDKGLQPFANFERCEHMGITSTEKGFLVRLTDKFSRLSTFSDTGKFQVTDEGFYDTCLDIINYICLMSAYLKSKDCLDENCCNDEQCGL